MFVAAASPSKPVGAVKESMALTRLVMASTQQKTGNESIGAVVGELLTSDGRHAATEGGFMGFGGKQVNDAERAALAQIDKALGRA